jgi:ABC-type glycerol-3-phosphate transport system substrate-binding protein
MNSAHPSLSRRRVLAALGSGAAVMLLAACGAARPSAATTATTGASTRPSTATAGSAAGSSSATPSATVAVTASSVVPAGAVTGAAISSASSVAPTQVAGAVPAGRGATLRIQAESLFPLQQDVSKRFSDEWLAANPGVQLDSAPAAGDRRQQFLAAAAAGTPPDIAGDGSYIVQSDYVDGATITLDQYIDRSTTLAKRDIWPSLLLDVTFKGGITGLPYAPDTRVLYTRVDQAQQAGLDPNQPPKTWTEMLDAAKRAYKGSGTALEHVGWFPFWGSGGNSLWMVPYWQLGGELLNSDQTKVAFDNDLAIQALTWLKQVVDQQGGWQAIAAFRKQFSSQNGGPILMAGGTTYLYETLSTRGETFKLQAPTMQVAISSYPLPDKGGTVATYGGCHTWEIAKGSKHPDLAWSYLDNFVRSDNNVKFADRYDLVPLRVADTSSSAFVKGDPARALQAQEMQKRRFQIAAPGGADMQQYEDVVTPLMTGKLTVRDALGQMQQQAQLVLDKNLAKARSLAG